MPRKVKGLYRGAVFKKQYVESLNKYNAVMKHRKEIEDEARELMESLVKQNEVVLEFSCTSIEREDYTPKLANLLARSLASDKFPKLLVSGMDTSDTQGLLHAMINAVVTKGRKNGDISSVGYGDE